MKPQVDGIVPRDVMPLLEVLTTEEPALLIEGPRGSGKSTVLAMLAERHGARVLDLDDESVLGAVREDPAGALSGDGPIYLDEFQREPAVLSAIKRSVDQNPTPGRFVLAGSVSSALLPTGAETLTGRVHRLTLPPLSAGEILSTTSRLIPWLLQERSMPTSFSASLSRAQYFDLIAAGGYPAVLRRAGTSQRVRWHASYLGSVAERDLGQLVSLRHPAAIARLYRLIAQQTSGIATAAGLAQRLDLSPATARSYLDLLISVHLVAELPGWTAGVSAKTARRSKLHVTDTGLGASALGADSHRLASSNLAGPFLETYVVNEISKQLAVLDVHITMSHFRDRSGIEVDLVLERPDGGVMAIELKSATTVNPGDAKGLRFLRDRLGDRFIHGILFHTGPLAYRLQDKISALPIEALWSHQEPGERAGERARPRSG